MVQIPVQFILIYFNFNEVVGDNGRDPKCGGLSAHEWARPLFSKFTYKLVSFM